MKKKVIIVIILSAIYFCFFNFGVKAEENGNLSESLDEIIQTLDLSNVENFYEEIGEIFKNGDNVSQYITNIISGKDIVNYDSIATYCFDVLTGGIRSKAPLFITLFCLLTMLGIINTVTSDRGVAEMAYFAVYSAVICTVTAIAYSLISSAKDSIEHITALAQSVFPIILTLMSVTGTTSSVTVYTPASAFITNIASVVVMKIVFPLILFMLVISVVSNVNKTVKLKGLLGFCGGALKWIIGLIVAVFSVFLTVKGIGAGIYDGVNLRAIKYTLNSSVPIVGGLVKDGLDMFVASAVLIKNSLGVFAIIAIFGYSLSSILGIGALTLGLKLVGAVAEPIGDGRANDFLSMIVSSLNYVMAALIMVSLMYVVLITMIIYSSQILL